MKFHNFAFVLVLAAILPNSIHSSTQPAESVPRKVLDLINQVVSEGIFDLESEQTKAYSKTLLDPFGFTIKDLLNALNELHSEPEYKKATDEAVLATLDYLKPRRAERVEYQKIFDIMKKKHPTYKV